MPALAVWTPEDGLLGALAPLGLAAASSDSALVVDLDEGGPHYPGESSLADMVEGGPRLADLRPERRGVSVLRNGGVPIAEAAPVVEALLGGWGCVVIRLPPRQPVAVQIPVVPVRLLLPGRLFPWADGPAVFQATPVPMPLPGPGIRLPTPGRATVAAPGVGGAMGAVERIVARIVDSDTPFHPEALREAAALIAAEEAPLHGPGVVDDVVSSLIGLGPLERLLADSDVTDVLVNGPDDIWVERAGRLQRADAVFRDEEAIVAAVERVIAPLGLRLDRASPAVDARLADGSRLHAVIPPAAVDGPAVAVRRFTPVVPDLDALVDMGGITADGAALLRAAVEDRRNLLVSGGTGSGKTTLLNVLSREIPADERVVTIEDAAELRLTGHVVRLEGRPPNAEGAGEITLRTLVRQALRLRPDRIVVGEVRGPEALDLIQAMSTGHAGSMGTVHANGPAEALWRLETLAAMGEHRLPAEAVAAQLRSAVDLTVHMRRGADRREVASVSEVQRSGLSEVYSC